MGVWKTVFSDDNECAGGRGTRITEKLKISVEQANRRCCYRTELLIAKGVMKTLKYYNLRGKQYNHWEKDTDIVTINDKIRVAAGGLNLRELWRY